MTETEVVVAGAGPVGLMLAAELRLAGVEVTVLERLPEPSRRSKAFGLHARSAETMELRGLVEELRAEGRRSPGPAFGAASPLRDALAAGPTLAHFAGIRTLRIDELDSAHTMLGVPQAGVEAVLAERAVGLGARLVRGAEIGGMDQHADGVTVTATDGRRWDAAWLVGCDGGRSTVRHLAGFAFPGTDPTITGRLVEATVPDLLADPGPGWHRTEGGVVQVLPGRVLTVEFDGPPTDRDTPVTSAEAIGSMSRVAGRPVGLPDEPTWMTRFTDNTRLVDGYRRGRVLLAGDAAHVHSPFGGQGLNLGLQDAVNLGWKLAAHVRHRAPLSLLDTYDVERRPVAARVLHNTRAQVALMNPDPRTTPLREMFAGLMELDVVNHLLGRMIGGLDVRYDLGGAHPLVGGFLPATIARTDDGREVRATTLMRSGRPLLLWPEDVAGRPEASSDLVVATGAVDGVGVLVRPDGYVAWAGSGPDGLRDALHACGVARPRMFGDAVVTAPGSRPA